MTDVREVSRRAAEIAQNHPPSVVLENLFFGVFMLLALAFGRLWFHSSKTLIVIGLAIADGWRRGAKVPPKLPKQAAPAELPESGHPAWNGHHPPLDQMTPYGPNVQAWSESG